ncbi:hypothetical protein W97_02131 [Coniosporium apollinis CBS 100218]|uniref:Myb-like domain-containing protein n=1 Tax=Coniosporium apollinis (strain CBS 100218) TaxID=1168221 RepID=R7YML9_CONA1|nr:uncharacterized protein W97_02131 [Coniosporium apollinis CBS 100218]EON62906.1 hypothetical protein W97_02131 [Coniosporium apollinis CBS 100218]
MDSLNELGISTSFDPCFGFDDAVHSEKCSTPVLHGPDNTNPVDGGHGDDVPQHYEPAGVTDEDPFGAEYDMFTHQNVDGNSIGPWGSAYISPEQLQAGTYPSAGSSLPAAIEDENYASFAPAAEELNPALDDGTIDPSDIHESVEYDDNERDDDDDDEGVDEDEEEDEVEASSLPPSDDEYSSGEEEELAPPPSPTASPSPAAAAASESDEEPEGCCGFCDAPDDDLMVACENGPPHHAVEQWYHFSCVSETAESLALIDPWICPKCLDGGSESSSEADLPSSPAAPAASTKVKRKKLKDAPKRSAWSQDEDKWCMLELPRIDAELKRAGNHRIDDLWAAVSAYLTSKYGMKRGANAVRSQWIRRLRFVSGHDERRAANPGRMRTSLLSSKKRKASGESDPITSTADASAPASKKRRIASTTPAKPATLSSAPTSSASKPTSSAPTSAAKVSSANTSFADDAPPASPAASSEHKKSGSPQSRPTLGGKSLYPTATGLSAKNLSGTRPTISGKAPPSSTVSGKYLPGTKPTVSGKRPPGASAVSGKVLPGTARKAPVSSGVTQQASSIQQATQQAPSNPFNSRKRRAASISDDEDDDDDDDSDDSDAYNDFITQQPPKKSGNSQLAKKKQRRSSTTHTSTLNKYNPRYDSGGNADEDEYSSLAPGLSKYTPFDPSYTYDVPPPASAVSGGASSKGAVSTGTGSGGAVSGGAVSGGAISGRPVKKTRTPGAGLGTLAESILGGTGAGTTGVRSAGAGSFGAGTAGLSTGATADTTTAAPGESDEDFAKRLDAQFNGSGVPGASRTSRRAGGRK